MGTTRSGLSDEEQQISDKLAEAFADYINSAGIKDESGNALKLEASSDGIYQAGSYYDYMKSVIEESLEHFLVDTEFPYDASASSGGGMGGGPGGGGMPDGNKPDGAPDDNNGGHGNKHGQGHGNAAENNNDSKTSDGEVSYEDIDDITRNDTTSGLSLSGTYETAQDYIDAMNENEEWVKYDSSMGKVHGED